MPTTTNRALQVPVTGTESGTWGDNALNPNFNALDKIVGAVTTVALTNVNVTLAANQYVCGTIRFTGILTGNVVITFPSVQGWWTIDNRCTGDFYIRLSCGAGNKICPPPGELIDVQADGTDMAYRNLPHLIGGYWDYGGAAVPTWVAGCSVPPYLLCDGSSFSAVTYPFLNTILGGTTLPDARGRGRFNLNGGTGRITTAGSNIDGDTRFSAGGAQTVTLDTTMIPAHSHGVTDPGHDHDFSSGRVAQRVLYGAGSQGALVASGTGGDECTINTNTTGISIGNTGGGAAHTNMPPAYIGGVTMIRAA